LTSSNVMATVFLSLHAPSMWCCCFRQSTTWGMSAR
jgi:hypothetical protein